MADELTNYIRLVNASLLIQGRHLIKERTFRIDTNSFFFVTAGTAEFTVNLKDYGVGPNDLMVYGRGSYLQLRDWSDDFRGYAISFPVAFNQDMDLLKSALGSIKNIIENPLLHIGSPDTASWFARYCGLLYDICSAGEMMFRQEVVRNMMAGMVFAINGLYRSALPAESRENGDDAMSRKHEIAERFMKLVMRDYKTHRDVSYYAGELCITPKHLGFVIKSVTGIQTSEVISRIVIMDAKSKLKSSEFSIAEIAYSLDFPNPSFFSKYFKKHTGRTPKEFRDN